jgi:hypothetical protein
MKTLAQFNKKGLRYGGYEIEILGDTHLLPAGRPSFLPDNPPIVPKGSPIRFRIKGSNAIVETGVVVRTPEKVFTPFPKVKRTRVALDTRCRDRESRPGVHRCTATSEWLCPRCGRYVGPRYPVAGGTHCAPCRQQVGSPGVTVMARRVA